MKFINPEIDVPVIRIPIITLNGIKYALRLPESSYGQWMIFKKGKPVFYIDIFHPYYDAIRKDIEQIKDFESHLSNLFNLIEQGLSLKDGRRGIFVYKKSKRDLLKIRFLPLDYFLSTFSLQKA